VNYLTSPPPDNGLHPTGIGLDVIRRLGCFCKFFPEGDARR
jgi:hypothetical protein